MALGPSWLGIVLETQRLREGQPKPELSVLLAFELAGKLLPRHLGRLLVIVHGSLLGELPYLVAS